MYKKQDSTFIYLVLNVVALLVSLHRLLYCTGNLVEMHRALLRTGSREWQTPHLV